MKGPRETVYDDEISPLMTKIIEIVRRTNIPMVASFELDVEEGHEPTDPMMCTTISVGPDSTASLRKAARILAPQPSFVAFAVTTKPVVP